MILTVGSTKGGVGKTTLAFNLTVTLAHAGQDVLLIDGDEQAHSMSFTELRSATREQGPGYTAQSLLGNQLRAVTGQVKKYRQVVIDVGGRDTSSFRNALLLSDLILVPTVPRTADIWGSIATVDLVNLARSSGNARLRAVGVINRADARGRDNSAALDELKGIDGLEVSPVLIGDRKAYHNAMAKGLGILEFKDHNDYYGVGKAQADFVQLFNSLYPKLERKIA